LPRRAYRRTARRHAATHLPLLRGGPITPAPARCNRHGQQISSDKGIMSTAMAIKVGPYRSCAPNRARWHQHGSEKMTDPSRLYRWEPGPAVASQGGSSLRRNRAASQPLSFSLMLSAECPRLAGRAWRGSARPRWRLRRRRRRGPRRRTRARRAGRRAAGPVPLVQPLTSS